MPGPAQRDYYEVLGMARDASPEDIKKAYRKLAIRHHPDRNPDDKSAEEQFKEASEAYAVLGDPEKRSRYDRFGHAGVGGAGQTMNSEVFADFQDLFRGSVFDLFGEMFGGGNPRAPAGGRDIQYELSIDFSEPKEVSRKRILVSRSEPCDSCRGSGVKAGKQPILCGRCGGRGQETFSRGFMVMSRTCSGCSGAGKIVRDPCRACGGDGRTPREREITVPLPAGISDGNQLRIPNEGEPGARGGPPGDLYVRVHVRPARGLRREDDDVLSEATISFPQAVLGTEIPIPTIWGEEKLRIPPGTQPHTILRLRSKGFPALRGRGRGNHLVRVLVEIPRKLSDRARTAVDTLAGEFDASSERAAGAPSASPDGPRKADRGARRGTPDDQTTDSTRTSRSSFFDRIFS